MIKSKFLTGVMLIASMQLSASDYKPLVSEEKVAQDINHFAKKMAKEHQFDENVIANKLLKMSHRKDIIAKITKPAEGMPWYKYRKIWMKDKRIKAGIDFWRLHAETLAKAEAEYGVEQSIIVGIIGVETFFGRIQGNYPVIEALHTLGFYYPKRSAFFRSELEHYYLLARDQGWDIDDVKGSYAGAMGMGQFISSSYRAYGVDFNKDGKVNLFSDPVDMIGSVANYFKQHKWKKGGFVAEPVAITANQKKLVQTDLALNHSLDALKAVSVNIKSLENRSNKGGIFAFELADKKYEHWLVGDNFYVITRYNRSSMYALAVFQLSQAIKAEYQSVRVLANRFLNKG
ncbi:lytic murein transglycosylase B [Aliikangiella sp. IMCC44359]|uniref:lytic murein transglycosylase B n=1 Tax=Aliikangiella sp. IMCC44359 TaxID=3459125 RepID=UPI00403A95C9